MPNHAANHLQICVALVHAFYMRTIRVHSYMCVHVSIYFYVCFSLSLSVFIHFIFIRVCMKSSTFSLPLCAGSYLFRFTKRIYLGVNMCMSIDTHCVLFNCDVTSTFRYFSSRQKMLSMQFLFCRYWKLLVDEWVSVAEDEPMVASTTTLSGIYPSSEPNLCLGIIW
jgi:hypothetical protein